MAHYQAMNTLTVSVENLRRAMTLREQIENLTAELAGLLTGGNIPKRRGRPPGGGISAAGRASIAEAQRARWAKLKGNGTAATAQPGTRRKMSAAGRARIAAAAKKRWRLAKAAGKNRL